MINGFIHLPRALWVGSAFIVADIWMYFFDEMIGKISTHNDNVPPASDMGGDVLACRLYAGLGCEKITDIPTVADFLTNL
jgi:hypothetical protein